MQPTAVVTGGAFAIAAAAATAAQGWFWVPLAALAASAGSLLLYRHLVVTCVAWLLLTGATMEMTLGDLVGPGAFYGTIAAVKAAELGLAALCVLRYGPYPDLFNPGLAFASMFAAGLAHGLYPALTATDSLRSLLGSVAPFAFGFARLPPGWGRAMVRATAWIPLVSAAGGAALAIGGLHPMFIEAGGQRLAGLGHPAYLAGVCLAAIYACLIELYRDGHRRWMLLLGANFAILLATGARAPLACGVAVTGLTLLFVESDIFPHRRRIGLLLVSGCVLPVLAVLAPDLPSVRLFNVLTEAAADFSGRDLLWPAFARAADASPLLGWGVGAGNAIIPPDSDVARIVQSWAAHNEYLRILVEGGQLGRALLIAMLSCWVVWRSRALASSDKAILRLAFAAFAVHAYTDNVLIATTACVFFAFATGVFARTPAALRRTPAMA